MSDLAAVILGVSAIFCVVLVGYFTVLKSSFESKAKLAAEAGEVAMQGREMLVQMSLGKPKKRSYRVAKSSFGSIELIDPTIHPLGGVGTPVPGKPVRVAESNEAEQKQNK